MTNDVVGLFGSEMYRIRILSNFLNLRFNIVLTENFARNVYINRRHKRGFIGSYSVRSGERTPTNSAKRFEICPQDRYTDCTSSRCVFREPQIWPPIPCALFYRRFTAIYDNIVLFFVALLQMTTVVMTIDLFDILSNDSASNLYGRQNVSAANRWATSWSRPFVLPVS